MTARHCGRLAALVVACLAAATPARGQQTLASVGHDGERIATDALWLWAAPFRMDAGDLALAAGALGTFGALTQADANIQQWLRDHPRSGVVEAIRPFRGFNRLQDMGLTRNLAIVSAGLYVTGFASRSRGLRDAGLGCLTVDVSETLERMGVYALVARERPRNRDTGEELTDANRWGFPGGGWEKHSFPAGHAANIMSCVSFWNHRYHMGPLEPVLYATAVGVAFGRTVDQRHWTSDTFLGMAYGYAMGAALAGRYGARDRDGGFTLAPFDDGSGRQAVFAGWTWRF